MLPLRYTLAAALITRPDTPVRNSMHDFEPRSSVIRLRARLARRLALVSMACLLALLGLIAALVASALAAGAAAWSAIDHGQPLRTVAWVGLGLACFGSAVGGVRALLRLAPQPEGIRLPRAAAEDFFRLLDDLARRAGVEPVEQVRITDEINAAVVQRPSLGLMGAMRTELLIGLPLVHSLSPAQFGAVLAHEFGHMAAQRQGLCGWGAYLRAWWMRTVDALLPGIPPALPWLARHGERLCRDMLRLARIEELEADAVAARLVGPVLLGETLVELSRKAHFLKHDYWPRVQALRSVDANSAVRPFREMGHGVAAGFSHAVIAADPEVHANELRAYPFHPSLRRRLSALRMRAAALPATSESAAEHFFASLLPSLAWIFDRAWWEASRRPRHPMAPPDEQ